jgi:hypothetical protein
MQRLIPALLFALAAFVSCTKSDDTVEKNPAWVVTSYATKSQSEVTFTDQTSLFAGYTFEFNDDNTMVIHKPDGSVADAQWGNVAATSNITFKMDNPFAPVDAILGDWPVNEQTDTDLKLERTTGLSTASQQQAKLEFKKQ